MKKNLRAAVLQHSCSADQEANLARSEKLIKQAVEAGAELILLQELHTSLYFCLEQSLDNFSLAEKIPGKTTNFFAEKAKEHGVVIVCSVFEHAMAGLYYNTAVVIEKDGSIAGKYRKMHIPQDPGYEEKFYFSQGDLGFTPISTSVGKLGVLICWDQWFVEAARIMALKGAEILLYPTAIGYETADNKQEQLKQLHAWQKIQQAHAIANGVFVMSANRIGLEKSASKQINFWGNSFICDPMGENLVSASDHSEAALVATLDINLQNKTRDLWPFFRDRRVDAYQELLAKQI